MSEPIKGGNVKKSLALGAAYLLKKGLQSLTKAELKSAIPKLVAAGGIGTIGYKKLKKNKEEKEKEINENYILESYLDYLNEQSIPYTAPVVNTDQLGKRIGKKITKDIDDGDKNLIPTPNIPDASREMYDEWDEIDS